MEAAAFRQAASKLIACVTGSKACQQLVKHVSSLLIDRKLIACVTGSKSCQQLVKHVSSLLIYRKLIACVTGRAQDDVLEVAGDSGHIR